VRGYTLDAGAFIALERRDRYIAAVDPHLTIVHV
jgi:hypothetical protein